MTHASLHPIAGVIFDMDGLLLDSESLAMDALVSAGSALGYDMPRDFCHLMIGAPADRCRELATERYGADFPLARYFDTQEAHLRALVDGGSLRTKPGVAALLDHLDAMRLPRAIATSSSRARTDHHLALVGLAGRFDQIVTRDDVARGKPNPDPFLKAAETIGIDPRACLALEDSYNGIRAAHAAGMRVIMVPDLLHPTEEMRGKALRMVRDLNDVVAYLQEHAAAAA